MCEIFLERDCLYSLKDIINNQLYKSTVKYGIDSIVNKGPQIWQNAPYRLKKLRTFKYIQMQYNPGKRRDINCQCNICKTYIRNVGYVH